MRPYAMPPGPHAVSIAGRAMARVADWAALVAVSSHSFTPDVSISVRRTCSPAANRSVPGVERVTPFSIQLTPEYAAVQPAVTPELWMPTAPFAAPTSAVLTPPSVDADAPTAPQVPAMAMRVPSASTRGVTARRVRTRER